jgi:hypothetical protein
MAGKATTLAIKITSDNQTKAGFDDAGKSVDGFSSKLDKASVVAAGALTGIGALGKQAFDAASEAQQAAGSMEAVFGNMAGAMQKNAASAFQSVGLSQSAYEESAATIGALLKNSGMDVGKAFSTTSDLIQKGADMAAVFGGTASDAVDALSSALKGEMDPIEKYGISLNQTAVQAQMASDGTSKLTGAQAKAAQTQAILELITKQGAETQGQWSKQAGTAAEATQIAGAAWENAKATLGERLLPVVTACAQKLGEFAGWAQQNQGTVTVLIGVIGGLAAAVIAVKVAMTVWEAASKAAAAAQWILNTAMDANPIGLVVLAIAAVIAGVVLMYNKFAWFRDFVKGVGQAFAAAFDGAKKAVEWVVNKIEWLINAGGKAIGWVKNLFSAPAAPIAGGQPAAGLTYGASRGAGLALRTAGLTAGGAGAAPAGAAGLDASTTVNLSVTFSGVVGDPVAVGAQIDRVVRDWSRATGRQLTATMSR